jgi:hypothetical protein
VSCLTFPARSVLQTRRYPTKKTYLPAVSGNQVTFFDSKIDARVERSEHRQRPRQSRWSITTHSLAMPWSIDDPTAVCSGQLRCDTFPPADARQCLVI